MSYSNDFLVISVFLNWHEYEMDFFNFEQNDFTPVGCIVVVFGADIQFSKRIEMTLGVSPFFVWCHQQVSLSSEEIILCTC